MKKLIFLLAIVASDDSFSQETLQTVTDRSSITSNRLLVTNLGASNPASGKATYMGQNPSGFGVLESYDYSVSAGNSLAINPNGGFVGIGTTTPAARLDVNGGIRASETALVALDAPLSASSFGIGHFQAFVTLSGYQNGARPGYGFHAGNTLGMYLYANTENQLRIRNGSNADYEILHSGNFNPDGKASNSSFTGSNDMNAYVSPGFYEYETAGGTITNSPYGDVMSANFKVLSLGSVSRQAQIAFTTGTNDVWIRNIFDWGGGRTVLPWAQLYTSANFTPGNYLPLTGGQISGNIGIGAENNSVHKLAVNGSAIFKKVIVKNATPWPDYVFDSSYRLTSLHQIEKFIQTNKHLPEVPSAAEVKKEGLDLGDNQVVLLKKIEELTLYIIEQDKQLEMQKTINEAQVKDNADLKTRLEAIEKMITNLKRWFFHSI